MAVADIKGCDYLGQYWPEDSFLLGLICALAIPVAKAHELWGYGRLAAPETTDHQAPARQPKVLRKDQAPDWDGKRLLDARQELKNARVTAYTQKLADSSGLPAREITRRISEYENVQKTPMGSMSASLASGRGKR